MLVLLGHLVISILASQAGLQTQGGIYHMFFWEAVPKPQKTKNKGPNMKKKKKYTEEMKVQSNTLPSKPTGDSRRGGQS